MRLRNKKTGEIGNLKPYGEDGKIWVWVDNMSRPEYRYNSLAELNEEWEDYEEQKEYWFINDLDGKPMKCELRYCPVRDFTEWSEKRKEIGNYFETKEEAEKAEEKLKALANLRKRGLKFNGWDDADRGMVGEFAIYCDANK